MEFDYVVSADSHLVEPYDLWSNALGAKWGDAVPQLVQAPDGMAGKMWFTGRKGEYFWIGDTMLEGGEGVDSELRDLQRRAGYDPEARLKCLAMDRIDAEVLTATWMLYGMRIDNPDLRRACARVYNDWAIEFAHGHTDTFVNLAMLPVDDLSWALKELERVAAAGARGIVIFVDPPEGSLPYRDPHYDPLWKAAAENRLVVMLHIITGRVRDPFTFMGGDLSETPRAQIEVLHEVQPVLAADFIFGGILDRFPTLKVVTGEYEVGWVPYFSWRCQQFQDDFGPLWNTGQLPHRATEYITDRIWYGVIDDPEIRTVMAQFDGNLKIVWGSDFPHPRNTFPNTHAVLSQILRDLPAEQQRGIVGLNAAELFGLPVPAHARR
jgi:uncharacterized protein